jgi:hypothetical protein
VDLVGCRNIPAGIPIVLVLMGIAGPAFPRRFLTPCDLDGRPTRSGELIELQNYRKRLRLDGWGLPNATLQSTFRKRIFVTLGPGTTLLRASGGSVSRATCVLESGDIVATESSTGKTTAYKFE